jgi:hypothetical protein
VVSGECGFKLFDALVQRFGDGTQFVCGVARGDVLGTVPVERDDLDGDQGVESSVDAELCEQVW